MTSVGGEEVRIAENAPLAVKKPARKRRIMAGSDKTERGGADHRLRTAGNPGRGYARVPSRATLSTSTTSTSIATECGNHQSIGQDDQKHFEENEEQGQQDQYYYEEDEEEEDDEENNFESDRLHFQQLRQISLGSANKYKMEMEVRGAKDENLRNAVPFVRELSDAGKLKERGSEFSINGDVPQYRPTKIYILTQILAALSVSMGSLVVGYATAYTSPALATMIHENSTIVVTVQQGSWVGGLMPLAALVGGILGGPLIEYLGRRNTILATGLPFTISWILIATAPNVYMVYVGRAIGGLCVGIGSLSFPVYLGETVQPEVRGRLGLLPTALGNVGILICFCAGYSLDWSNLAFLGALLPVPFVCLTFFIPETPRWYVSQGQTEKAREALVWLRGDKADVNRELGEIVKSHSEAEHRASGSKFGELFEKEHIRPVLISLGLMFFQQMSGINAVIFYTVTIFKAAESDVDENLSTIIVGIVNFGSTFVATLLIDRLGRKMLLYISAATMIITLMTLGSFFYVLSLGAVVEGYGWVPLVSMVMYVIGFSLGFGPIPWLMMGEILPAKIRGTAASVATAFNWSCTFVVTKTFADVILSVGTHGAFWMFGIICVFGLFFTIFWVPETRGKSLEEIEQKLSGRTRQTNSIANNKPSSADC